MIAFSFKQWSSGARNGTYLGIVFRRFYWQGRWTPLVFWWPHRVSQPEDTDA